MLSYLMIIVSAVLWGTISIYYRNLTGLGMTRMDAVFTRVLIAAVIIGIFLLIFDRKKLRIRLRDLWIFIGTGLLSMFTMNISYCSAIDMTSAAVAAVLLYTAPVFVAVMSVLLFRDKLSPRKIFALLLTIPGCALVSGLLDGGGGHYPALGIGMGLLSGFSYALYTIFSRYALDRDYSPLTISFWTFAFSSLAAVFFVSPAEVFSIMAGSAKAAVNGVGLGFLTAALPYFLYTRGLEKVPNSDASVIATVEPVVAALVSLLIYHEPMSLSAALGIVIVLGAVLLINIKPKKS